MSSAEVWWKYVPSSRLMVKSTAREITENSISVQIVSDFFPWKNQFELDLFDCIDKYGAGIALRELSGADLNQYPSLLSGIVHTLGIDHGFDGSIQSVGNNLPEAGCVIWLHNLSRKQQEQCFDLSAKAAAVSGKNGFPRFVFLLESDIPGKHKGVKRVEKGDFCRPNIRYFVYRMLMEAKADKMIEYAVALVMETTNGEIEQCGELCEKIIQNGFEREYQVIEKAPDLHAAIHRAQIRSVEPLIQIGRLQLCSKYSERIRGILPFVDDYNTYISIPYEMELRHLLYRQSELYLTPKDKEILKKLYDARNDLSHQRILDYSTLTFLVDSYS